MKNILLILFIILCLSTCKTVAPAPIEAIERESPSMVFAIIGDYGSGKQGEGQVAKMVKNWEPEFIATLGDNNYGDQTLDGGKSQIGNYYEDYIYNPDAPEAYQANGKAAREKRNRFFPAIGNHDVTRKGNKEAYLQYFTLPGNELYYDVRQGDVHLFFLDSGQHGNSSCCDSEQSQWLKTALANSTAPYKLVCFHHPPYSATARRSYRKMRWPFEEWGASVVLNGHDHVYARIASKKKQDFFYLVNGLGGARKYKCDPFQLPEKLFKVFCYDEDYGAIKAKVYPDKLTLEFLNVSGEKAVDIVTIKHPQNTTTLP